MAQLHALCFDAPPPWRAEDFAGCLSSPLVFVVADAQGVAYGFALGRVVADEAELLTLAILPTLRRQGRGRALLAQFHSQARQRGGRNQRFLRSAPATLPLVRFMSLRVISLWAVVRAIMAQAMMGW